MPRSTFLVRRTRREDEEQVCALVPRLRAFGAPPLRNSDELDAGEARVLRKFYADGFSGGHLWVAEREGEILAAAYAHTATDYFTQETHGHLGILMVAEHAEGQGIGSALLRTVEEWAGAQGFRFLTLNVFAGNVRAQQVYERAGYRQDAIKYFKPLR